MLIQHHTTEDVKNRNNLKTSIIMILRKKTLQIAFDKNKIWIYNNMSNTVHGQVGMSLNFIDPVNTNFTTLNWDEFYITNINNINTNNILIQIFSLDCSLNYPCPCHD